MDELVKVILPGGQIFVGSRQEADEILNQYRDNTSYQIIERGNTIIVTSAPKQA